MALHHMLRAAAGNAGPSDPYFEYNTLLLTGDGTNGAQNNTFLDSSSNAFTITRNGNTTQGTFSPYGNLWSNYFDGTGDYLTVAGGMPSGASSAFTMECWIYLNDISNYRAITRGNASSQLEWGITTAGEIKLDNVGVANICTSATNTIQANRWYHVAVTRSASNIYKMWVNGVNVATSSTYATSMTANTTIGYSSFSAANFFIGYISNFRVVTSEVYTSNFTPSTTPLTAVSGTSLLTCQSNRFIDNSSNNFTLTVNGNTSVQRFSPFNPTAPYSATTIGGSGYFDGSGDYLTLANNAAFDFGSGNFTLETFFYPTTSNPSGGIFCKRATSANYAPFNFGFGGSLTPTFLASFDGSSWGINFSSSISAVLNSWNHLAVTRNGSTFTIWVNGQNAGTASSASALMTNTAAVSLGATSADGTANTPGYFSNSRIVKGTAVYTSAFTPPTSPLTAITNTSLLLNFTNAGIPDAAMMNDLETVGNAQVSTSVKKYGTGSLAFDGTGDYLVSNSATTDLYAFGTGDFTIEFWLYSNNSGVQQILYDGRASGTNGNYVTLYKSSANVLELYVNSGVRITGTTAIAATTWYHVALCRSGTSTRLFLNGVQQGSTYSDSTNYLNGANRPVIGADSATLGNLPLNGYIDDLRITKGYARYTTTFTPPTAALPVY